MKRIKILSITVLCICFLNLYGQEQLQISNDTVTYERIFLDEKVAFLNVDTREIVTEEEYLLLHAEEDSSSIIDSLYIEPLPEDYWDTLEVNPYKGVSLSRPFLLLFPDTVFHAPVDHKMHVTSRYGRRRRGPHRGIDIDLEVGDPVRSVLAGRVRFVGYSKGHGKTVVVRHHNDLETVYAHLSEYQVRTNDFVQKGEILGLGGATGNARGSHLHLELRHKGVCINPEYIMNFVEPHIYADSLWVTKGLTDPWSHSSYSKGEYEVLRTKKLASGYDKRARKFHVVRSGDTLWAIARTNGMTVNQLVKMNKNKVSSRSTLRIGQHLIISP